MNLCEQFLRYASHAEDYLTDMMCCFENYIVRGTAEFLRLPDYRDAFVTIGVCVCVCVCVCARARDAFVATARRLLCEPRDYGDQAEARNAAKIAELLAS